MLNEDRSRLSKFIRLAHIAEKMLKEGIDQRFVDALLPLAFRYEGIFQLMVMWGEEKDPQFKEELILSLSEEVEEERKTSQKKLQKM